jgi:hypothetical protein
MNGVLVAVALLAIWPMSAGKKYQMTVDGSVPAASGEIAVQIGKDNENTKVNVKVDHLARPANLTPAENAYVVWIRPGSEEAHNQGVLRVGNNLKGELTLITTSKNFDVFITAEQSGSVIAPSGVQVLHTHVSQ